MATYSTNPNLKPNLTVYLLYLELVDKQLQSYFAYS